MSLDLQPHEDRQIIDRAEVVSRLVESDNNTEESCSARRLLVSLVKTCADTLPLTYVDFKIEDDWDDCRKISKQLWGAAMPLTSQQRDEVRRFRSERSGTSCGSDSEVYTRLMKSGLQ